MNGRELAELLGVSQAAVSQWSKEGMPASAKGRKGQPANYDLASCLRWLNGKNKGQSCRMDRPGAFTRVDSLSAALQTRDPEPKVQMSALARSGPDETTLRLLDAIQSNFAIAAAGLIRFGGMKADQAVDVAYRQIAAFALALAQLCELDFLPAGSDAAEWYRAGDKARVVSLANELVALWAPDADDAPAAAV